MCVCHVSVGALHHRLKSGIDAYVSNPINFVFRVEDYEVLHRLVSKAIEEAANVGFVPVLAYAVHVLWDDVLRREAKLRGRKGRG